MNPISAENPARPSSAARIWRAGTLTYTAGALTALFCWILWGDFAWQMKERSALPIVQIMLRKFDASDFLTGLFLLALPAAIGVVLTPAISYRSDRHRGRWGRRIPYLLITSPIATIAMYGLAYSPTLGAWLHQRAGGAPEHRNFTIIAVLGLSWTIFEFATLAANAIFAALVNDVVPRELIGRFYGMFRAVMLLTGMFFNYFLIGHVKENFLPILIGIGTVYGAGMMLMSLRVKEGEYPPPAVPEHRGIAGVVAAVKDYCRECFSRPYYVLVIAAIALPQLAFTPVNLFAVYAAESFGLSMTTYGRYGVVMYGCSLVLAYPLGWLADRFHPLRLSIITTAAYAVVMAVGFFAATGSASFGTLFLLHGVLSGCYFTGAAALGQMLFPKMKFAQFYAAVFALISIGGILLGPSSGKLLDTLGHDYHYTFGMGSVIGFAALVVNLVVYRRFLALGGPKGYVAPE